MITHIRMKNFKSWQDSGEVKLAPLTGFFGTNSSGKSSLLQMLLLLKQTAERSNPEEVIFWGDESSYVNLGDFREVFHKYSVNEFLVFEFGCSLMEPLILPPPNTLQNEIIKTFSFTFNTSIQEVYSKNYELHLSYTINDSINLRFNWNRKGIKYENLDIGTFDEIHQNSDQKNCYGKTSNMSNPLIFKFTSAFEEQFSRIFYLGPIRAHPLRQYHWEGSHPEDIGRLGDKMIDALLSARVDRKTIQHDDGDVSIEEKISEWLREMNLASTFILERIEQQGGKDYDVRIQMYENGPKIALTDMGYGLSQFLPVLVLCYYAPEGSTLILEQPGIHLHPMVQSQLADLLIEVVNERKLQILVESHSEHLLNRLQRRIAEEKINVDQTTLYFCRNDNGVSQIEHLNIDEFGNISNWPENFFGNEMGDLFERAEAEMKRRKNVED